MDLLFFSQHRTSRFIIPCPGGRDKRGVGGGGWGVRGRVARTVDYFFGLT
jgi:hypothetical protein